MDKKIIRERVAREHLSKIASNHLFSNSTKYIELLTYLVDKALNEEHIKELTIGVEFFKKSYDSAASDSIVRVNMHNLRKKLDAYYAVDGKDDGVKFQFQSRNYNLIINDSPRRVAFRSKRVIAALLGIIISISVICGFAWRSQHKIYFWENFLDSKTPTICIVADHLMLTTEIDGSIVALHHKDITTKEAYERHIKENHIDSLSIGNFSFFTKSIPYATQRLGYFFGIHGGEFTQQSEQTFNLSAAKEANIIYVGQPKLMNRSKLLFLQNSKKFRYENYRYYVTEDDGTTSVYTTGYRVRGFNSEYGMVCYTPLKSGMNALFFISNNDIGIMATIDKFTDQTFLKELYSNLESEDSYFNILYKANGVDRVDFNLEIIEIEEIK